MLKWNTILIINSVLCIEILSGIASD